MNHGKYRNEFEYAQRAARIVQKELAEQPALIKALEAMSIKELISQGRTIQSQLNYIPPPSGTWRTFKVYEPASINEYYTWKEYSIKFLQEYCSSDLSRFVKYSDDFEKNYYLPQYLANMIGVLEACNAIPNEKMKINNDECARQDEIAKVEELEQEYLGFRKMGNAWINTRDAIDAFRMWHATACVLFDKWFYSTDEDFVKFQSIDAGSNGFGLNSEYKRIYSPYCKLMSRLKEGREIKRNGRKPLINIKVSKGVEKKINIFISYSHADAHWLEELKKSLKVLSRYSENVEYWEDTQLRVGDKWKKEIEAAIERANVAILLVSTDFLASDFVSTDELPPLLKKAEENGTRILPLIVSPCDYEISVLEEFQAVNSPEKTLADLKDDEAAIKRVFLSITKEIRELIS